MLLPIYNKFKAKFHSLVVKKQPKSEFLSKKPKLTKIVAYNDTLDFNQQATHIFNQIKNNV